jgi:hypothetical protein
MSAATTSIREVCERRIASASVGVAAKTVLYPA